jgi:hypothetical protein
MKKETPTTEVKKSLSDLLTKEYINDMAENHISNYKDRYFRKSKSAIRFDLNTNHDDSLEIERVELDLGRNLSDKEIEKVVRLFHAAVVKLIY